MNIVKISIVNKQELCKLYIQQFKRGGIFVTGKSQYALGDEVFLLIQLAEGNENLAVTGTVCWQSPDTAVGYPVGLGIQFNNDKAGQDAKAKIEILLGGCSNIIT